MSQPARTLVRTAEDNAEEENTEEENHVSATGEGCFSFEKSLRKEQRKRLRSAR